MPITAIFLLKVPSLPLPLPVDGPVRVEKLDDSVLLHTTLDFADDPEDLAGAVQSLLGPVAEQHDDERGVFLIPSVAAPKAHSYAGVIEEVADGGVWAPWEPADLADDAAGLPLSAAAGPELAGLLGSMLGGMPQGMLAQAAASLREDPSALQDAAAQLPGLLQNPSQMPELAGMLQAMGVSGSQLSDITKGLQEQLARDPAQLLAMAEGLFGAAGETDDEDDDEDEKA